MRVLQSSRNYETDRKLPISYVKSCDVAGDDKSTDSCSPTALYGLVRLLMTNGHQFLRLNFRCTICLVL